MSLDQAGGRLTPHRDQRSYAVMFLEVLRRGRFSERFADRGGAGEEVEGGEPEWREEAEAEAEEAEPLSIVENPRVLELARQALGDESLPSPD